MTRTARAHWAIVSAVMLALHLTAPSSARADDRSEAEGLFQEALEALENGRAAEGRDLLRSSLALHPTLSARVNLAIALRRTGETPEAITVLGALLAGEHGDLTPLQRVALEEQLTLARDELATVRVAVSGPDAAEVELDGEPRGDASSREPLTIPVAAGDHVVTARADGFESGRAAFRVSLGERSEVALSLSPTTARAVQEERMVDRGSGTPEWVWLVVAGGVFVAGAVVATVLILDAESAPALGSYATLTSVSF